MDFGTNIGTPLLSGIVNGSVYGLVALGIVLVYKANGVFNFAQAAFAEAAAFITMAFLLPLGGFPKLPYPVAVLCGLASGALIGLLTERVVVRPLFAAPRATLLVATAGVALLVIALEEVLVGISNFHVYPQIGGPSRWIVWGYAFGWTEVTMVLALLAVGAAAIVFFRTRYGLAILAVSQDAGAASVVGISVRQISALTWGLAGLVGAAAGVVAAPFTGALTPGFMTVGGPLINGFIAAVLGGTTSLAGPFVGGIGVGLIGAFAGRHVPSSLPGGQQVVLAALLLLVLLVRPTGLLGRET